MFKPNGTIRKMTAQTTMILVVFLFAWTLVSAGGLFKKKNNDDKYKKMESPEKKSKSTWRWWDLRTWSWSWIQKKTKLQTSIQTLKKEIKNVKRRLATFKNKPNETTQTHAIACINTLKKAWVACGDAAQEFKYDHMDDKDSSWKKNKDLIEAEKLLLRCLIVFQRSTENLKESLSDYQKLLSTKKLNSMKKELKSTISEKWNAISNNNANSISNYNSNSISKYNSYSISKK